MSTSTIIFLSLRVLVLLLALRGFFRQPRYIYIWLAISQASVMGGRVIELSVMLSGEESINVARWFALALTGFEPVAVLIGILKTRSAQE